MGPLTLAVDIDVLLSSGSIHEVTSRIAGPQPSFSYGGGERPASAAALPTTMSKGNLGTVTQHQTSNGSSFRTQHVWMRPGVRRFLLAIQPHFQPVLLVRRRCNTRRCCCIGGRSGHSVSNSGGAMGSSRGGIDADGTTTAASCTVNRERDAGDCGAALLAAALPYIDPDGQFFGERIVLVQQDQPRPRTAHPRVTRMSCPGGAQMTAAKSAVAAAAAAAAATATAPGPTDATSMQLSSVGAAANMAVSDLPFPVAQVSNFAALPAMLGGTPSAILIVTVADRSLFGSGLAKQVVQCQPYRKEYGKYDDLLDCLASVVSDLLIEPSVSQGLLRLGLLHSKLQPSPMMQALHAQAALRQAVIAQQQQQQQQEDEQQHFQATLRAGDLGAHVQTIQSAHGQPNGQQQPKQQPQQPQKQKLAGAAAGVRQLSSTVCVKSKKTSRKAGSSRRDSENCGGEDRGSGGGRSASGIPASPSASPLPPIPELPFLEVGSEWQDPAVAEGDDYDEVTATATATPTPMPMPAGVILAPEPFPCDRSSGGTSCSSNCIAGTQDQGSPGPSQQYHAMSSPPTLCCTTPDSASTGSRPSRSSAGSNSSGNSNSNSNMASPAAAAASVSPHGVRRMAWDDVSIRPSRGPGEGPGAASGKQAPSNYSGGSGGSSGGVFSRARAGSSSGGELGWRPSSFPAATKPHVTRHVSDRVSLPPEPNQKTTGFGAVEAPPVSPLGAAASAVAAATSRLFSRILGGRRQRRCRPSDASGGGDGDGSVNAGVMAATAAAVTITGAGHSATSATQTSSRTWGAAGEGSFHSNAVVQQVRSASASAVEAPLFKTSLDGGRTTAAAAAYRIAPHAISSEVLLEPGAANGAANAVSASGAMTSPVPSARTTPATCRPAPTTATAKATATADATISSPSSQSQMQMHSQWQLQAQSLAVAGNNYIIRWPAVSPTSPVMRSSLPGSALDSLGDFPSDLEEQPQQQERRTAPVYVLSPDTVLAAMPGYKAETVGALVRDDTRVMEQEEACEACEGLMSVLDATGRCGVTTVAAATRARSLSEKPPGAAVAVAAGTTAPLRAAAAAY
ncbi:hypothetical protein Vafri_6302 [Volvox africanus]|uniref:Uncharacterized protein n=1 Tax=Volvox africanus TaxID=51714 RepID=A0A8J4AZ13_9CHLO|nr:hypothetical protein Vafri_6302 [Volvox africanus]